MPLFPAQVVPFSVVTEHPCSQGKCLLTMMRCLSPLFSLLQDRGRKHVWRSQDSEKPGERGELINVSVCLGYGDGQEALRFTELHKNAGAQGCPDLPVSFEKGGGGIGLG